MDKNTAMMRPRRELRPNTDGTSGPVCGFRPGRQHLPPVSSATASFPLRSLLGALTTTPAQQTIPNRSAPGKPKDDDCPAPAAPLSPTVAHHHHASTGGTFVMGSPPGTLGGSHTQPANCGLAAHGCYRVFGPARISKRGECLIARMLPGSRLELMSNGGASTSVEATRGSVTAAPPAPAQHQQVHPPAYRAFTPEEAAAALWEAGADFQCTCTSDEEGSVSDDGAVTECVLVASYVELGGSASSVDMVDLALQNAVHHHNGRTYLSVRNLPPTAVISLAADGALSHPVNVTPPSMPPPPFSL